MNVKIHINCDNDAFVGEDDSEDPFVRRHAGLEVGRILRCLANSYEFFGLETGKATTLMDLNGNSVGEAEVEA
jgi:hypothetical protein